MTTDNRLFILMPLAIRVAVPPLAAPASERDHASAPQEISMRRTARLAIHSLRAVRSISLER